MEVSASQCSVQCPVQRVCACVLCCIVCVDDATPAAVTHTTIVTSSFLSLFFRYTTGRVFGLEAFPDGTQYQGEVRYVNARRDGKVVLWSERLVSTAGAGGVRGAGGGGAGGGRQEEEGAERAGAEGGAETGAGAGVLGMMNGTNLRKHPPPATWGIAKLIGIPTFLSGISCKQLFRFLIQRPGGALRASRRLLASIHMCGFICM